MASDIFRAFLVEDASFSGTFQIPILRGSNAIPEKIIPFSKAITSKDSDAWVMFYEYDEKFMRIWNSPRKYIPILKKFKGIISPDFSMYRAMPLSMQIWSTYQGKAFAYFCEKNEIEVIPNVRFSDCRSFEFCFSGIPKNTVVSIGTHGCIKRNLDKKYFKDGLKKLVSVLSPHTIIVYGAVPDGIFSEYQQQGINIIHFESETSLYYKNKEDVI